MKRLAFGLAGLALLAGSAAAQNMKTLPINQLIDNPTGGILQKGDFSFDMNLYAEGGVLLAFGVGLLDRLNMGASFGGTRIISDQNPDWNGRPELALKYRLFDETVSWPALVLGYSGQGHGRWLKDAPADPDDPTRTVDRYEIKAKGFYAAAGKNYLVGNMGLMGLHLGANVNPMENDDDAGLNMWFGVDKSINDEIMAVAEYDFAWDDIRTGLSKNKGFLNLGARWTFAERLSLEMDFRDVLTNRRDLTGRPVDSVSRELRITYMESF
ncbi:MAG: hypothetical protein WC326_11945 [Candidatus Delongbacteria bacterium]